MIPVDVFKDQSVAVFGLGDSGISAAEALIAGGAIVSAWDDGETGKASAEQRGVPLAASERIDWTAQKALVLSPGIPLTHPQPHPVVEMAGRADCPIIGDIELFARTRATLTDHSVVAVTGTNGKSTTTALIAHLVDACGREATACGNIGEPILSINPLPAGGVYVIEMSSYQIDLTTSLLPQIAILLNLSPDHIDRHGTFENYAASKRCLLEAQAADGTAIVGIDDDHGCETIDRLRAAGRHHVIPISAKGAAKGGVWVDGGQLIDDLLGEAVQVANLAASSALQGFHNWQNAAAAYAATRVLGIEAEAVAQTFASFPGLPHRLELIATVNGVKFINDSKATNADAAAGALAGFSNIHWITGGISKKGGIAELELWFNHVKKAYLIGESGNLFAEQLADKVDFLTCETLSSAFTSAVENAQPDDVVLLSPACASQDQFTNFVERGNVFRNLVSDLQRRHA